MEQINLDQAWMLYCSNIFFSFTLCQAILVAFYKIIFHMHQILQEQQKEADNGRSSHLSSMESFKEHNFDSPTGSKKTQRADTIKNKLRDSINSEFNNEVKVEAEESLLLTADQVQNQPIENEPS